MSLNELDMRMGYAIVQIIDRGAVVVDAYEIFIAGRLRYILKELCRYGENVAFEGCVR